MMPIRFEDANLILDEGTARELPTYHDGSIFVSRWRATWRERLSILLHGKVWFVQAGQVHQQVGISGLQVVHFEYPITAQIQDKTGLAQLWERYWRAIMTWLLRL